MIINDLKITINYKREKKSFGTHSIVMQKLGLLLKIIKRERIKRNHIYREHKNHKHLKFSFLISDSIFYFIIKVIGSLTVLVLNYLLILPMSNCLINVFIITSIILMIQLIKLYIYIFKEIIFMYIYI